WLSHRLEKAEHRFGSKNLRPGLKHGGGSVMQDNDPKHTARNVENVVSFSLKQQLHTPPQSDAHVMKNLLGHARNSGPKHQIRNKAHLKQVLQEEWDKISPDTTKKLVESVPRPKKKSVEHGATPLRVDEDIENVSSETEQ
ncbi:transposable element Tcb1 transposase, partial [Trichonephila clavipes]